MATSQAALIKRINRRLRPKGQLLKKARGERARRSMGDFYGLDTACNLLLRMYVNPETLAYELGVIADHVASRSGCPFTSTATSP